MAFDKPQSRNEAILQNMLGANNELEPPKSRVEVLLQDIAGQMPEANPSEGTTTGTLERLKIGDDIYTVKGGGSGTSDYDALNNKPQIAGTELQGNKSLADLGIASASALANKVDKVEGKGLSTNDFTDAYKTAIGDNTNAINGIKNGEEINSFGGVESALALKQNATDNNLDTDAKTIVGAINEHEGDIDSLKSGLTDLTDHVDGDAVTYPYADVITVEDAVPANLADCSVKVEPVQDLHGYDKPWVGGAGKNKLPLVLDNIKAINTNGTWNNNVYTIYGVTFTVNTDNDGNIISILVNGTSTAASTSNSNLRIDVTLSTDTQYILSGCPSGGSYNTYRYGIWDANWGNEHNEYGSGTTFSYSTSGVSKTNILITGGTTANNLVFYPMIRLATETDATFAPYTNICPISGHTEAVVTRVGKNLVDNSNLGHGIRNNETGEIESQSNTATSITIPISIKGNTNYCIGYNGLAKTLRCYYYDANMDYIGTELTNNGVFTTPSNCAYYAFQDGSESGATDKWQLELGSTATPYEPYAGQQYTLALGDTIYGGTVDFDSGVMKPSWKSVNLGSYNWGKVNNEFFCAEITDFKQGQTESGLRFGNIICSDYDGTDHSVIRLYFEEWRSFYRLFITDPTKADMTENEFKTAMNGVQLCYELATPTTIQLTPEQIQLLQGTNTLTASTGDISVTVNGVSGAIGSVQEQVNELAEDVAEIKPVDYSTTEQKTGQKWVDGKDIYIKTISLAETDFTKTNNWFWQKDIEPLITGYETIVKIFGAAIIEFDGSKHLLPFGSELYNVNNSDKCIKFANYYRNIIIKGTPYNDSDINFATKNLAIVKCNITVAYTKAA